MTVPDPLKPYRLYLAMFLVNLAVLIGVIYLLRREVPARLTITEPPTRPAPNVSQKPLAPITISIAGAVRQSGTLSLAGGARLADALQQAGVKPEADVSKLDLTLALQDGDKIFVPSAAAIAPTLAPTQIPAASLTRAETPAPAKPAQELVNLNTATLEQLMSLPHIGETLAQRILDYRAAHNGFKTVDELKQVKGIGDAFFDDIADKVTVE